MDNETLQRIKDQLFNKKTKDYTNLTFFFLIFSIFAFFVIRPSLTTAFSLQTKEEALKKTDMQYEEIVSRIPAIQATLEEIRLDQYLITQALPEIPNLNNTLQEIRAGGSKTGLIINKMTVNDVALISLEKPALKRMIIEIEAKSTYDKIIAFQREIHNQKRLKRIKNFEIIKEDSRIDASESGMLKVQIQIEGYYL